MFLTVQSRTARRGNPTSHPGHCWKQRSRLPGGAGQAPPGVSESLPDCSARADLRVSQVCGKVPLDQRSCAGTSDHIEPFARCPTYRWTRNNRRRYHINSQGFVPWTSPNHIDSHGLGAAMAPSTLNSEGLGEDCLAHTGRGFDLIKTMPPGRETGFDPAWCA